VKTASFDHPYPATKLMWKPDEGFADRDLIATSGDFLRLWNVTTGSKSAEEDDAQLVFTFNNNRQSEFCAPLTSIDWNRDDLSMIGTSSIDTTCTIWNIETQQVRTQLIAHDEEVYDIAFARGTDRFATAGRDGSVRIFDLRELQHSTIMYESPKKVPLLRVGWNEQDPHFLATIESEERFTTIIDIRMPNMPVAKLGGHSAPVTAFAWAPQSSCHICSAGDDARAFIWTLAGLPEPVTDPMLEYGATAEISNMKWSSKNHEWISIALENKVEFLRV
jgi:WD repeat-containing protein 68